MTKNDIDLMESLLMDIKATFSQTHEQIEKLQYRIHKTEIKLEDSYNMLERIREELDRKSPNKKNTGKKENASN